MDTASILIVEDERLVAADIEHQLIQLSYQVSGIANSAANAYKHAAMIRPDLALMDINLKGSVDGIQAAKHLREELAVAIVFLTAHADPDTLRQAVEAESFGYVIKPFNTRALAATVEMALYRRRVEAKIAQMERLLTMTLHSIGDGVIATDRASRVSFMNPVAEELTGWSAAEALGRPLAEVFNIRSDHTHQGVVDLLGRVHSEGTVISIDEIFQLTRRDGSTLPIDNRFAPIREGAKKMLGVVITFRECSHTLKTAHAS